MNTEFGRLSTKDEMLVYTLLVEQRKTNELLQALLEQNKQPEPEVVEPEPEVIAEPEPKKKPTNKT